MNKFSIILSASLLTLSTHVLAATGDKVNDTADKESAMSAAVFGDPEKGGIGYEWTVKMPSQGKVEITGSVGGKSSFEPQFDAPDFGWTHTSDWVALEIKEETILRIKVSRQGGIYELQVDKEDPTKKSYVTAGAHLYPAVSIYDGWDSTTAKEKGSFNPTGNFWSTIQFKDKKYSKWGEKTIMYHAILPAGKYSVNIGGVNAMYCKESEACFNGKHGYRATFTTSPVINLVKPISIKPTPTPTPTNPITIQPVAQ